MQSYAALLARSSVIRRSFPIRIVIGWITVRSAKPIVLCGLTAASKKRAGITVQSLVKSKSPTRPSSSIRSEM